MLELEDALDDLRDTPRLLYLHRAIVLRHYRLLLSKVALATEHQVRTRRSDFHIQLLPKRIHVTANLLEIYRGHVNNVREVEVRDLDLVHIRVKEFEEVVRDRGLIRILHTNAELVRIRRW